jgi:hypothetical protein
MRAERPATLSASKATPHSRASLRSGAMARMGFMNLSKIACGIAAVLSFFGCRNGLAYEDDVHAGLTLWLAMQAQFDASEAELVADGDISYDHSALSATNLVFWYACAKTDREASALTQENHFPGDGPVPGEARGRPVGPGSLEARRKSDSQIVHPSSNRRTSLRRLGQGLHPLQDSWSHQGIPGSPAPEICEPDYSWGHPDARKGWWSHKADLTYHFPEDTIAMAEETYRQLCAYSEGVLNRHCAKGFDVLRQDVEEFAVAKTKAAKQKWFNARGIEETPFLRDINLKIGRGYKISVADAEYYVRSKPDRVEDTEEGNFARDFFNRWMTWPDAAAAIQDLMRPGGITYRYAGGTSSRSLTSATTSKILGLWRVRDHGEVAEMLHDQPFESDEQLSKFLSKLSSGAAAPYESLASALLPLDQSGRPILVEATNIDGGKRLVATAKFQHAPNDAILVIAEKHEGADARYEVSEIVSIVEHGSAVSRRPGGIGVRAVSIGTFLDVANEIHNR